MTATQLRRTPSTSRSHESGLSSSAMTPGRDHASTMLKSPSGQPAMSSSTVQRQRSALSSMDNSPTPRKKMPLGPMRTPTTAKRVLSTSVSRKTNEDERGMLDRSASKSRGHLAFVQHEDLKTVVGPKRILSGATTVTKSSSTLPRSTASFSSLSRTPKAYGSNPLASSRGMQAPATARRIPSTSVLTSKPPATVVKASGPPMSRQGSSSAIPVSTIRGKKENVLSSLSNSISLRETPAERARTIPSTVKATARRLHSSSSALAVPSTSSSLSRPSSSLLTPRPLSAALRSDATATKARSKLSISTTSRTEEPNSKCSTTSRKTSRPSTPPLIQPTQSTKTPRVSVNRSKTPASESEEDEDADRSWETLASSRRTSSATMEHKPVEPIAPARSPLNVSVKNRRVLGIVQETKRRGRDSYTMEEVLMHATKGGDESWLKDEDLGLEAEMDADIDEILSLASVDTEEEEKHMEREFDKSEARSRREKHMSEIAQSAALGREKQRDMERELESALMISRAETIAARKENKETQWLLEREMVKMRWERVVEAAREESRRIRDSLDLLRVFSSGLQTMCC